MNVFQNENEIKRLNSQEELLQKAQDEILNKYLSEKNDLVVYPFKDLIGPIREIIQNHLNQSNII